MSTFITCTSSTRPPSPNDGDVLFETDTKNIIIWDGTNWRGYANDGFSGWSGSNTYSMNFDGTDDRLNVASPVTTSAQQGTVSAWIKTSSQATTEVFCQSDTTDTNNTTYLFLSITSGGHARINWRSGSSTLSKRGSTVVDDGNWHHVVFISDGSAWKIYVDGTEETLTTVTSGGASGSWYGDLPSIDACRIGCQERNLGTTNFFNGNIDEVAVWDTALSSSQITNIYKGESNGGSGGTNGTPGNLLSFSPNHWWRMGDGLEAGSGTTVYDMSLGNVNATVVNATGGSNTSGADFDNTTTPQ
jgi:hypothetical protein